ncbi:MULTISPECIES: aldose epimerase family protein [unclassified Azospirillum]|uniref:aldose epimerase family protein n=1 Tax=unclassified Azospirillum TaxID=2630922 RepID=UPI000B67C714|nr:MULTISPECIES: aldose epimerase family protein [unclassified Azospirillum]SNS50940.1 aldose 1-epimerase [Azospirillum sp. RU38E]SNS70680.1 aldose 1-epimerase [Azospirillum sp. RU37A]
MPRKHLRPALVAALCATSLLASSAALAASASRAPFGELPDGTKVEAITLINNKGVSATILTYGATLQALKAPDRTGAVADIVLGHDTLKPYVETPNYFGITVGRYANRIAGGRFTLDGKTYQLTQNDKQNSLHGGVKGFDKHNWQVADIRQGETASVALTLTSPDGDQGYPGTLSVKTTYALDENNVLSMTYEAATDKPTIVNMTNHAIFNLAGEGSPLGILRHKLTLPAAHYTPVNAALIPTGELKPVEGTVFDFRKGRVLSDGLRDGTDPQIVAGRGYDHNFAIDSGLTPKQKLTARLEDLDSGRVLEVYSTQPGIQVYTGNFLDGTLVGKQGHLYRMSDGIALEPQKFPDAPNQPAFTSARVDPGKPYRHEMSFRLSVAQ